MKTPLTYIFISLVLNLISFQGNGQLIGISGKVTSENDGSAIAGADILECRSKTGTISDESGNFQLLLPPGEIELLVSKDGFAEYPAKMTLHSDTTFYVHMKPRRDMKNRVWGEGYKKSGSQVLKKNSP